MTQSSLTIQSITPEWQRVLDYYLKIQEEWKKEIYLRNLSQLQREYLLKLVQTVGCLTAPTQPQPTFAPSRPSMPQTATSSMQGQISSQLSRPQASRPVFNQLSASGNDFSFANFRSGSANSSLSIYSPQSVKQEGKQKMLLGDRVMNWMFSDKDSVPVVMLKFSFVPLAAFLSVAMLTNSAGVYNMMRNIPGLSHVLGAQASASASEVMQDYESWAKTNTPDSFDRGPYSDPDQDGLTNLEEFQLKSNPQEASTQKSNLIDGESLLEGKDPATGRSINLSDRNALAKYDAIVTRQVINLRLQMIALKEWMKKDQALASQVSKDSNLLPSQTVDTSKPGALTVEKMNQTNLPLLWTKNISSQDVQKDLESGAVHYPQTPMPGQLGNVVIMAHSSDYAWHSGNYKYAFADLDKLVPQDKISVTVTMKDGSSKTYTYLVKTKNIYKPVDIQQFQSVDPSELSLNAIWPNGLEDQVLQVRAMLIG